MSFTVSGLTNFTIENEKKLIANLHFKGETAALINSMPGIKSSEKINLIATTSEFQAGGTCGFNSSGTTTFTQRTLTIGKIKINEALCPKDLEAKYTQKALSPGSLYKSIPFEQIIVDEKVEIILQDLETADWQGDTTSGDNILKHYDGLLKLIDADANVISAIASTINAANIRTIFQDIYVKIPARVLGNPDLMVFCGYDTFTTYQNKLATDNLFHKFGDAGNDFKMNIENSNIVLKAVHGLDNTNRIIASPKKNLFIGFDLLHEEERFEMFFAREADEVRFVTEFKRGANHAYGNQIVEYTNA